MAKATTSEWGKYYETAEERRTLLGGDPLKRHLDRYILRERCLFAGASLVLAALVATFCIVLIH